jgi:alanyl aminopeptidase
VLGSALGWAAGCTHAPPTVNQAASAPVSASAPAAVAQGVAPASAPASTAGSTAASTIATPPIRLPDTVRPERYALDVTLDPTQADIAGKVSVTVQVTAPTQTIWIHARGLTLDTVAVTSGGSSIPAQSARADRDHVLITLSSTLAAGEAELDITYHGQAPVDAQHGLFREKQDGNWYEYTQFEPVDARRAFPCFDEPGFKVPWQVTLHVPRADVAVSNTPETGEKDEAGGKKSVSFAATRPLPSYLVAFAVGPFDVVDAGTAGKAKTPLRILVLKGKAKEAAFAKANVGPILEKLEDYFDMAYPYPKLDFVDVPRFFGAMENAGLITCLESALLDSGTMFASTIPHEMAHQWFGDLVTMAWWNDLWLNEGFAEWMDRHIVREWKPDLVAEMDVLAMIQDAITSSHAIRQPLASDADIDGAFDLITYEKGGAILGMFEDYLGPDVFRAGIRAYVAAHKDGNVTANDFIDALSKAAGTDLSAPFSSFLDQAGVPALQIALSCDPGKTPTLGLSQNRALTFGLGAGASQTWQIPLCVSYGEGKDTVRQCTLFKDVQGTLPLTAAGSCPTWVEANDDGTAYFLVNYDSALQARNTAQGH